ncbi:hypothetical protein NADE_005881 [Nannochloris sp. 'desiccata']|nr:hypothetical protein NADE_005881 [Chlorella desiccata (nom. nud.)]
MTEDTLAATVTACYSLKMGRADNLPTEEFHPAATDTAAAVAAAAHATLTGSAVAAAQPTIDAAFVLKVSDHLQLYNGHSPDRKVFFGRAEPFFKTAALSVDRWRY